MAGVQAKIQPSSGNIQGEANWEAGLFPCLPLVCFCFDFQGRLLHWNRAAEAFFGLCEKEVCSRYLGDIAELSLPHNSAERVVASLAEAGSFQEIEWQKQSPQGTERTLRGNFGPIYDREGTVISGICLLTDVTELRSAERALRLREARLAETQRLVRLGSWEFDTQTWEFTWSEEMYRIFGGDFSQSPLNYDGYLERVHSEDRAYLQRSILLAIEEGIAYEFDYRLQMADGAEKFIHCTGHPILNEAQEVVRLVGTEQDVTHSRWFEGHYDEQVVQLAEARVDLEHKNAILEGLATTDGLTGLKNHRAFQEQLEREYQNSVRYQQPLSLVMLDVDKFKDYNDAFGHPAGDEVLKSVAQALKETSRKGDYVARYGGEEFVLILPNTDQTAARHVAERLRTAIELTSWPQRPVTASLGAASYSLQTRNWPQLIEEADAALYHSKKEGRNRIMHYGDLAPQKPLTR